MITFEEFQQLDLRVARIVEAKVHPSADRLYVLTVDVDGETRQIVAGIRSSYTIDELSGRKIVIVNNLEPATIRGEESAGMLLAAGSSDGPVLLMPEKDVPSGAKIK